MEKERERGDVEKEREREVTWRRREREGDVEKEREREATWRRRESAKLAVLALSLVEVLDCPLCSRRLGGKLPPPLYRYLKHTDAPPL